MDKKTALTFARRYADEVAREINPAAVIMYGSHVTGKAREDSDIDVAVIFDGFEGDFLKTSAKLWNWVWQVNSYIEPILLDIKNDKSGFAREIMESGELIYQKN
jgi:predicted nucleotidyltransferase